jgi:hypothetical protein
MIVKDFQLAMGKWRTHLTGKAIKRMPKMPSDILAVWIKPPGPMEPSDSSVHTGIPRPAPDLRFQLDRREAETCCVFRSKPFNAQWVERPVGGTFRPPE